jgi:hypothetical protein
MPAKVNLSLLWACAFFASNAYPTPWLEQHDGFLINWSQLTVQFQSSSEDTGTAALGEAEAKTYKGKELAAWQAGSSQLRSLLTELIKKGGLPIDQLPPLKDHNTLRPSSTRTVYYTNGGIEIRFRFDLREWVAGGSQTSSGEANSSKTLVIQVPKGVEPALAYNLCPQGSPAILAKDISPKQWKQRLGGLWYKGDSGVSGANILKIDALSQTSGCINIAKSHGNEEVKSLFLGGAVAWVQAL